MSWREVINWVTGWGLLLTDRSSHRSRAGTAALLFALKGAGPTGVLRPCLLDPSFRPPAQAPRAGPPDGAPQH